MSSANPAAHIVNLRSVNRKAEMEEKKVARERILQVYRECMQQKQKCGERK